MSNFWRIYTKKKVVVSEMFQLTVDKDLSFENSQGRSTTHGMFEKATFFGPNPFSRTFLISLRAYQPTKGALYFCLASKHIPSQQKNHTPPSLRFFFHRDFPIPRVKPTVQESHGHLEPLDFDLKGNKSRGVRGVRGSSPP